MRKTIATMLTMGLAAGFVSAQTPGSGVGSGGNNTSTTQRPAGAGGSTGAQGSGGATGATGTQGSGAGGQSGATGTGGATSSQGARVGGTQGAGGTTGSGGTAGSQGAGGATGTGRTGGSQGTGTGAGAGATGRGTLGGQGTATGAAGSNGVRGTGGTGTGVGTDTTRAGAASDPAGAQMSTDMLFAASAAVGGMAEVGTSRIAMERAGSDEVKQFAQRMVEDHTRANRELMTLATQKGLQQPRGLDIKDQADVAILSNLSGEEFDKAYTKQQLASHICSVNQFTAEAAHGRDPELKAWAAKMLPALKEHKMMVQKMADRFEKAEHGDASRNQ